MNHLDTTRHPEEILAEIDRTRTDLDLTLEAIEHRLAPGELVDQGIDYLRHSGGREFVSNLGDAVKSNPLPVALVGMGVAWLMFANRSNGDARPAAMTGTMDTLGENLGDAKDWASETGAAAKARVAQGADAARAKVAAGARGAREKLDAAGDSARAYWRSVLSTARDGTQRARAGYEHLLREEPLAVGALGLACGALLAAVAPRTRTEDDLLGESAAQLRQGLKDAGEEGLEKATRVASAATEAGMREAERESAGEASPQQESPPEAPR